LAIEGNAVMRIHPILAAMTRNKFGAMLIVAQMAVTLAFITNSFALIEQRVAWSARPTGLDEANVFVIRASTESHEDLEARRTSELAALRSLSGVMDAYITNDYPLQGAGSSGSVSLSPDQKAPPVRTSHYLGDEHAIQTLGVTLIAGRNFTPEEVTTHRDDALPTARILIVSKALANILFPKGDALGKSVYLSNASPSQIVGIIDRLQGPSFAATGRSSTFAENSTIRPNRPINVYPRFMVRVQPGRLADVMKRAERTLLEHDSEMIMSAVSMKEARAKAYLGNRGLVVLLVSISTALLLVTGFGIVGLTSYWVTLRRQQIGIRRALGATRLNILQHFQRENLMIAGTGALAGAVLAVALNLWMVQRFEMVRMANTQVLGGALLLLVLGQIAVFLPARRAAWIPPALATRGG
jgi:putative ABC transport system permease protein